MSGSELPGPEGVLETGEVGEVNRVVGGEVAEVTGCWHIGRLHG